MSVVARIWNYFQSVGKRLLDLRDTPHAIAGGVAIGIFMGFTPLFGFKTLLSLGLAYLFRCNPIAAVIAVSLHDVATPFLPFLIWLEYNIGFWILHYPHVLPPPIEFHAGVHLKGLLNAKDFYAIFLPILLGSVFLSAPSALLVYGVTLKIMRRREARQAAPLPPT